MKPPPTTFAPWLFSPRSKGAEPVGSSRSRPWRVAILVAAASLVACRRDASSTRSGVDAGDFGPSVRETKFSDASTPSAKPPVVVAIVVDQLAAWVAAERFAELPADGGFARLRREGTFVASLRYAHAVTDTAPGHAALFTGETPAESGIFGNEVLNASGDRISILADAGTTLVGTRGALGRSASSLARLHGDTIADVFRRAHPDAFIVAFSLKDRGALFSAGRTPTAALWYDTTEDAFVTSSAVASSIPPWANVEASHDAVLGFRAKPWEPMNPAWVSAHARTPDRADGEGDVQGFGVTFPHRVSASKSPGPAFRASPFGDDALFSLARAAMGDAASVGRPTLLSLSLSSNDYVGHVFGPDSWEAWDELYRVDAKLGVFLKEMDARYGSSGYSVVLAADHGVAPMPEARRALPRTCASEGSGPWEKPCRGGGRLIDDKLRDRLRAVAQTTLGAGAFVAGVADPYVFLGPDALALDEGRRRTLLAALTRALRALPDVADVFVTADLPRPCPADADDSTAALVCRSAASDRAAALYVVPRRGSYFDPNYVEGYGASHGTPYLFDRTVPLFVRAPGRVDAGAVVATPLSFATFAVTASALLGVPPPLPAVDHGGVDLTRARPPTTPHGEGP